MKIYISAVNEGFEHFRDAAVKAVRSLQHDVLLPDEVSSPDTADAVVFLLGSRYGDINTSGVSMSHEHYRQARGRQPLFIFVKSDADMEGPQEAFRREVQATANGYHLDGFVHPDQLRSQVTGALHRWEIQQMRGKPDAAEMIHRAQDLLKGSRKSGMAAVPALAVAVTGGPLQAVIPPALLESEAFKSQLLQAAMFGCQPVFTSAERTISHFGGNRLELAQETRSLTVTSDGSILMELPLEHQPQAFPVASGEEITRLAQKAISFASDMIQKIDPAERLSHVACALTLHNADHAVWGDNDADAFILNDHSLLFEKPSTAVALPSLISRSTLRDHSSEQVRQLVESLRTCFRQRE
jgi:hypothetical protein